jgi:hypothetical protein
VRISGRRYPQSVGKGCPKSASLFQAIVTGYGYRYPCPNSIPERKVAESLSIQSSLVELDNMAAALAVHDSRPDLRETLTKAGKRALGGGVPGAAAMGMTKTVGLVKQNSAAVHGSSDTIVLFYHDRQELIQNGFMRIVLPDLLPKSPPSRTSKFPSCCYSITLAARGSVAYISTEHLFPQSCSNSKALGRCQ